MNINNNFISILVNDIINTSIKNITERKFYLIKHCNIKKKYISSEILYKNVFSEFSGEKHTIKDLLETISNNLESILPIPILNGKYVKTNYTINNLPSKLIIIFVNMNIISLRHNIPQENPFNYIMNFINNNGNIEDLMNNPDLSLLSNIFPPNTHIPQPHPPPIPPPPPITPPFPENAISIINANNDFINENKEKYKDEIAILQNMGFTDESKIIESLIVSNGDINSSINYYLQ